MALMSTSGCVFGRYPQPPLSPASLVIFVESKIALDREMKKLTPLCEKVGQTLTMLKAAKPGLTERFLVEYISWVRTARVVWVERTEAHAVIGEILPLAEHQYSRELIPIIVEIERTVRGIPKLEGTATGNEAYHTQRPPHAATRRKKTISKVLRGQCWEKRNGRSKDGACYCCGKPITDDEFECGHVTAEADGGETAIGNLEPICRTCNRSMGTQDMHEFMATLSTQTPAMAIDDGGDGLN